MKLAGILVGKYGVLSRIQVEDDWQEHARTIGCEWVEYPRRHLGELAVIPICDEEFHLRQKYYRGAPVVNFDDGDIYGPMLIVKPGRRGKLASLTIDEQDAVVAELNRRMRKIAEGSA